MKKETLHELIEQYLDDSLPVAERRDFQRKLASDANLRAELEIHRALQEHLGDAGEQRLRLALEDVMQAPVARGGQTISMFRRRWLALAAATAFVLVACFFLWQRLGPETDVLVSVPPAVPETNMPRLTVPEAQEVPAPVHPESQPPQSQRRQQPMALANPADFLPNPTLEGRIGGIRGNQEITLDWLSPATGARFVLKNGQITLDVKANLQADSAALTLPLRLFIYSNKPEAWENKKPVFNLPFRFEATGEQQYRVDFRQVLRLHPGLYYIVVGQQRLPDASGGYFTLGVERFTAVQMAD